MIYSKRLAQESPTRFFVNNPTPSEAKGALEIGNVIGMVTNGNYLQRMLTMPETRDDTVAVIDKYIKEGIDDDQLIVALAAQHAVSRCAKYFMPLYEQSQGELGWAAIQGNPNRDTDYDFMVEEARRFYQGVPNMRVKFPATAEAVQSLETMTAQGRATLATCGFSVQYGVEAMEAYARGCRKAKTAVPRLYVTILAGHVDEYLEKYVKANGVAIDQDILANAGCEIAKELYKTWYENYRDINCRILGGCREAYHFTEMVPGDMAVTVNYDFIQKLNELDPPLTPRIGQRVSKEIFAELSDKLPAFAYSVSHAGKEYLHWSMVPTSLYFRNYVRKGWNNAAAMVRERRVLFR